MRKWCGFTVSTPAGHGITSALLIGKGGWCRFINSSAPTLINKNYMGEYRKQKLKNRQHILDTIVGVAIVFIICSFAMWSVVRAVDKLPPLERNLFHNSLPQSNDKPHYILTALTTAYNTVESQTDESSCISASGDDICGRRDVAACPIYLPFGTVIAVSGKNYICLDRMAKRYREHNRFDLSFDKDIEGAKQWGVRELEIIIYK